MNVNEETTDERRFIIWFRINEQEPFAITGLNTKMYSRLKRNNEEAYRYVLQLLQDGEIYNDDETIQTLWKSIDDVDYTCIDIESVSASNPYGMHNSVSQELASESDKIPNSVSQNPVSQSTSQECIIKNLATESSLSKSGLQLIGSTLSKSALPLVTYIPDPNISTSKKGSKVWKYFFKESSTTARCKLCENIFKSSGNTTNLKQHLVAKHKQFLPTDFSSLNDKRGNSDATNDSCELIDDPPSEQTRRKIQRKENINSISQIFRRANSFADGGTKADEITNSILFMLAVDKMPLSLVHNDGFKFLMKTIVPLYTVPSRQTMTRLMTAKYEVLKEVIKDNLTNATYCLTCDIWTDISNQSHLGVTVHYLLKDSFLKNVCLSVTPLYESHTAQYLATSLLSTIRSFDLNLASITAVITDSGANIKKAIIDTFSSEKHLPCFAHILAHLVPEAMKKMPFLGKIIAKVKDIIILIKRSVVASDELKRLQIRDGKTEGTALKFIQNVETRWNTILYMIERFLTLEQYVYTVTSKCPKAPDMLTRDEILILRDLVLLMKPVECVITEISGDSYPTCSIIIPIIHCMEIAIRNNKPKTEIGMKFKNILLLEIERRFEDNEKCLILAMSTILDPRFKQLHFRSSLSASIAISHINKKVKSTFSSMSSEEKVSKQNEYKGLGVWSFHDDLVSKKVDSIHITADGSCFEVKQYLSQPVIPRSEDPFNHWQTLRITYPSLYILAMQYLSIVGTSVPCERLFSKAGLIKTQNRNRLSGKHLHQLLLLSSLSREDWGLV